MSGPALDASSADVLLVCSRCQLGQFLVRSQWEDERYATTPASCPRIANDVLHACQRAPRSAWTSPSPWRWWGGEFRWIGSSVRLRYSVSYYILAANTMYISWLLLDVLSAKYTSWWCGFESFVFSNIVSPCLGSPWSLFNRPFRYSADYLIPPISFLRSIE